MPSSSRTADILTALLFFILAVFFGFFAIPQLGFLLGCLVWMRRECFDGIALIETGGRLTALTAMVLFVALGLRVVWNMRRGG